MFNRLGKLLILTTCLLSIIACSSNQTPSGQNPNLVANSVFFALNNIEIPPYYNKLLTLNASYLIAHPNASIQLQGNSSEVGTAAHNQELGLMRSLAVKNVLLKMGVPLKQITIVSYGNTKPTFNNEANGLQPKNQRVDIIYTKASPTQYLFKVVPMVNLATMY